MFGKGNTQKKSGGILGLNNVEVIVLLAGIVLIGYVVVADDFAVFKAMDEIFGYTPGVDPLGQTGMGN